MQAWVIINTIKIVHAIFKNFFYPFETLVLLQTEISSSVHHIWNFPKQVLFRAELQITELSEEES